MSKEGCEIECGLNLQQPPNKSLYWIFTPLRFVQDDKRTH